jgi:hypothetical protein
MVSHTRERHGTSSLVAAEAVISHLEGIGCLSASEADFSATLDLLRRAVRDIKLRSTDHDLREMETLHREEQFQRSKEEWLKDTSNAEMSNHLEKRVLKKPSTSRPTFGSHSQSPVPVRGQVSAGIASAPFSTIMALGQQSRRNGDAFVPGIRMVAPVFWSGAG